MQSKSKLTDVGEEGRWAERMKGRKRDGQKGFSFRGGCCSSRKVSKNSDLSPMAASDDFFAEILLPLALEGTYTYSIPAALAEQAVFGMRVEVQFGQRKRYAGLIVKTGVPAPNYRTKEIISILDGVPIITHNQFRLWNWMADYYCCTLGEVMKAALPGALLLSSETIIKPLPYDEDFVLQLDEVLYSLFRHIAQRSSISLEELQKLSGLKVLYPHVVALYQQGLIVVAEQLEEKYKPKVIKLIGLHDDFRNEEGLQHVLEELCTRENQTQALLAYLALAGKELGPVHPKELAEKAAVSQGVLDRMVKKGIFQIESREINRMDKYKTDAELDSVELSDRQRVVVDRVKYLWQEKDVVLLHGVTGSGKTLIYTELIREVIDAGGQALYLVPEIGLSVQVVNRLKRMFGNQVTISHSRLNENERVDLWNQVKAGIPLVAGVRSSIFLPFQNLKLVIVDEEQDQSYKQHDPNPRYNGRDVAIMLAHMFDAHVLLGSATPALETYYHSESGKYGRAELDERYLGIELPEIKLIDRRKDKSSKGPQYSHTLIKSIESMLKAGKQTIIFKNRRGYSPVLKCDVCGWVAECHQCDVSLTYHKARNLMVCHICGTGKGMIGVCPACGSPRLVLEGYGTEKIEDELQVIFPEARIRRMDLDTTRGKHNLESLIYDFEQGHIDILVGTQMVTKGLDFDHVGLVGVLDADQSLYFPDFRAAERTFQMLVQVSGRAGRKNDRGLVMIQTWQPGHPVFADVIQSDYRAFYVREIHERENFKYSPFTRQIVVTIRHKQAGLSREAAEILAMELKQAYGNRVLGPSVPTVGRVRNQFIHMIHIKMEHDPRLIKSVKQALRAFQNSIVKKKSLSTVRISIDVDPY